MAPGGWREVEWEDDTEERWGRFAQSQLSALDDTIMILSRAKHTPCKLAQQKGYIYIYTDDRYIYTQIYKYIYIKWYHFAFMLLAITGPANEACNRGNRAGLCWHNTDHSHCMLCKGFLSSWTHCFQWHQ